MAAALFPVASIGRAGQTLAMAKSRRTFARRAAEVALMLTPAALLIAGWPFIAARIAELRSPDAQVLAEARHTLPPPGPQDHEAAHFEMCDGPVRVTCMVDGDTIWYQGVKYRMADINAPETGHPDCQYEANLGHRATQRLMALLNQGRFSLVATETRDADVYGRKLRTIMRGGTSLDMELVREGLAEKWVGFRRNWC